MSLSELVGTRLMKIAMSQAAQQTVDSLFEPPADESQDSKSEKKKPTFFETHNGVIRKALQVGTSAAIPALLACTKHGASEQYTDGHGHGAFGQQSALSINFPNRGTNTNAYANGAPPDWLSPSRAPSLADLQSNFPDPSEVATPTLTCSKSRAAYSADQTDSDDSTIKSDDASFAPTSVLSAHSPRTFHSTPALDRVSGQIGNDDQFASNPSIVSRYDHEYRGGSAAEHRELDHLDEDVFSRDGRISASDSVRTAYRAGSSQW